MLEQLRPSQNDHTLLSPRIPRDTEHERYHPELEEELKTEEARTKDIEDMQEYMQSDEYTEKIAKEKIGLVKDNEIIFKENK